MNDKVPMSAAFATRDEEAADTVLQKWLSTLTVGNGAALFGALTLGLKEGQVHHPEVTLTSAWIFLIGVVAASAASVCLGAFHRSNEGYWRLSHAQDNWIAINKPAEAEALTAEISRLDTAGDSYVKWAWRSAIGASASFVVGVGVALAALTWRAVFP